MHACVHEPKYTHVPTHMTTHTHMGTKQQYISCSNGLKNASVTMYLHFFLKHYVFSNFTRLLTSSNCVLDNVHSIDLVLFNLLKHIIVVNSKSIIGFVCVRAFVSTCTCVLETFSNSFWMCACAFVS